MNKDLTTLFTGRNCTVLAETDSTNTYLSVVLRQETLPEGSAVRALSQKAGRGQAGSVWKSETGKNLLVSFVFYPTFIEPRNVFLVNKTVALGVHDFVAHWLGDDVRIKWPNDIYYGDSKIGGILIENSIAGSVLSQSILGIGININQKSFTSSLLNPISFSMVTGLEYDLDELFNSICSFIESRYLQLKGGDYKKIDDDYLSFLFSKDKWRIFEAGGRRFKGRIEGVDENGKLMLTDEQEGLKTFELKQIKWIS